MPTEPAARGDNVIVRTVHLVPTEVFIALGVLAVALLMLIVSTVAVHMRARRIRRLARTDELTGLANRRLFDETVEREWGRARRFGRSLCLVYIDLDGFKAFNDSHGHLAGDDVLRQTAIAVNSELRAPDMAARIGGDEFVVVCPETSEAGGKEVVQRLEARCADLPVPVSVGVAVSRVEDESHHDLVARADSAMYEAKDQRTVEAEGGR